MAIGNNGQVLSRQEYTPWSEARSGDIPQMDHDFTGRRKDDTGLLYYGARYYDLKLGRFLSADSIVLSKEQPQSRNRYNYVLNNPPRYTDPTGHILKMQGTKIRIMLKAPTWRALSGRMVDIEAELGDCAGENALVWESQRALLEGYYGVHAWTDFVLWSVAALDLLISTIVNFITAAEWMAAIFREQLGGIVVRLRAGAGRSTQA